MGLLLTVKIIVSTHLCPTLLRKEGCKCCFANIYSKNFLEGISRVCLYVSNFRNIATKGFDILQGMRYSIKILALLIVHFTTTSSFAQKVDGHWYGIGMLQISGEYNNYLTEMVLQQKGKNVSGVLNYFFRDSLVKVNLYGSFDEQTHMLSIKPFALMYYRSPTARNSIDCYMSGSFILMASKAESVLTGSLVSDANHRYTVPQITLRLKKSDDTVSLVLKDEPELEADTIALSPTPINQTIEAFNKREKVFTKELEIVNTTIRLELYDNGQVDFDSVSLFFNNKLLLPKTKLDHRAIKLTLVLDPTLEFNELSMFADNLGMIPPNTAALIVYDGKTRYETLLSSDLNKSASLKLKRKKE